MARKKINKKFVWQFTNKRKLTALEFIRYFERKVRSTIRKYKMPTQEIKGKGLKIRIINNIIRDLPERNSSLSEESLNNISNKILYVMIYGKQRDLKKLLPKNQPLYFLCDAEIELYAKIKKIKGIIEKPKNKLREINGFIEIIEQKNPDIRQNIVEALLKSL